MSTRSLLPNAQLEIVYLPPDALRDDPRNPRHHGKRHIRQLAKSIQTFGFNVPLAIDDEKQVIAGHGRLAAARLLNMALVPTVCLSHLDQDQRTGFMVADNRLSETSRWDDKLLASVLVDLAESNINYDIEAIGFSVTEIDLRIEAAGDNWDTESEEMPEPGPAVCRPGDGWALGSHIIVCGSCLDPAVVRQAVGKDLVDVVVSDPPYNVRIKGNVSGLGKIKHEEFQQASGEMTEAEFTAFLERALRNAAAVSRDGSLHYWAMDWRGLPEITAAGRAVYDEQINLCVWAKTNAGMGSFYRSQHELFTVWRKGQARFRNNVQLGRNGRWRSNLWTYRGANSFGGKTDEGNLLALHPTVKPLALLVDILLDCTKRGDIVFDPFLGSGSTIIAAEKVGRRARGIDLEPGYVDVAIRRWQRWSGEQARRLSDGALFDDLEAAAKPAGD
jgi:DNA modification methylase